MPSISTKEGDFGETALLFGRKVSKTDPRVAANGAIDELNVALGRVRSGLEKESPVWSRIRGLQINLVGLMAEIATVPEDRERFFSSKLKRLSPEDLELVDAWLSDLENKQLHIADWSTPGDHAASIPLEMARVISRRAERCVVNVWEADPTVRPIILAYLNRISDLLWILARVLEKGPVD